MLDYYAFIVFYYDFYRLFWFNLFNLDNTDVLIYLTFYVLFLSPNNLLILLNPFLNIE